MNEDTPRLLTRAEYDALPPRAQGYASYMQAAREGSSVPDENYYAPGTPEHQAWRDGRWAAYIACVDCEE